MSMRKINFAPGEYYHIYNRGNSKQKIFNNKEDYQRFIFLLFVSNTSENSRFFNLYRNSHLDLFKIDRKDTLVDIGAYSLMPNHFHILIKEKDEGNITKFMQKLSTAYVMYYNQKYKRTGSLFEGRFKSQHANTDRYLKYLFSYIHLNPIKLLQKDWKEKGIQNIEKSFIFLDSYKFSSLVDYMGDYRPESKILEKSSFPEYFTNSSEIKEELLEWLEFDM